MAVCVSQLRRSGRVQRKSRRGTAQGCLVKKVLLKPNIGIPQRAALFPYPKVLGDRSRVKMQRGRLIVFWDRRSNRFKAREFVRWRWMARLSSHPVKSSLRFQYSGQRAESMTVIRSKAPVSATTVSSDKIPYGIVTPPVKSQHFSSLISHG